MSEKHYAADRYPLKIRAGADFSKTWIYFPDGVDAAPRDWSGYTAQAQLRASARASAVLITFDVDLEADGSVTISTPASETVKLVITEGVWDIKVTPPSGSPEFLIGGIARVTPVVTR